MSKSKRERADYNPLTEQEWMEMDGWSALICSSVAESRQREVYNMGKTLAQAFKDEGALQRSREFFLLLLRAKFKTVPDSIAAEIYTLDEGEPACTISHG